MRAEAEHLKSRLEASGYDVCAHLASQDDAAAAEKGDSTVSAEFAKCLSGADVTYFLLDESEESDFVAMQAGINSALSDGKKIVAIVEGTPPQFIDDAADVILVPGSQEAVPESGIYVSDHPSRQKDQPRKIDRVKCQ
jgi:hypothetical protein